jgi:hypothetical protein
MWLLVSLFLKLVDRALVGGVDGVTHTFLLRVF